MLGFRKDVTLPPMLYRAGVRFLTITATLVAFSALVFLNSAVFPRSLPSVPSPSLESGSTSILNFVAIEKPTGRGINSSVDAEPTIPIITSPNWREKEKSSDPGRNTSIIDLFSPPFVEREINASVELKSFGNSDNGKNASRSIAIAEISDCKARLLPVVDRKARSDPVSLVEMDQLLSNNRQLSCAKIPRRTSQKDLEILRARREIENAAIIKNHPHVYAPVFRNISAFKRSYELMEEILKVYVYKEGQKPIFHSPFLTGIYSSESWFMKNMKESTHFRVQDPTKAHLFYLPFSSMILREKLYIDGSHSHKNIVEYLKNYITRIAATYPFWNRTAGADHFLAACHDWAPAETSEAMGRTIRALCNADLSAVYELGKDLTLPQAHVLNSKNPQLGVERSPTRERPILAFFAGQMHGYLRPQLLEVWGKGDPEIKVFGPLGRNARKRGASMRYAEYMRKSKFCICPRGYEVNSPRIVEAISHGCVPVIISDNFVPPFFEVLKWEEFSVEVKEEDIPRLKEILRSISRRKYSALQEAVMQVQKHFLWHNRPQRYDAFHMTLHSVWLNRLFQFRPLSL